MGLAVSQARLLTLTARKGDCEYGIAIESMNKMSLTREMSELSEEYYSRLQAKNITYFANGQYHKMNYQYLMGRGSNYAAIWNRDNYALKTDNSMILTDYKGQVIMSEDYAQAIVSVLGQSAMNQNGVGGTFSTDKIAAILAALCTGFTEETFQTIIDGNNLNGSYDAELYETLTGDETGEEVEVDNSSSITEKAKAIVDFYYPIFSAAAANGWTTEYNAEMALNDDYISDALVTGTFQLATVYNDGQYHENDSLNYFITSGLIVETNDVEEREEVTAWYNAQKEIIGLKEMQMDQTIAELSTELEAIKAEIQSLQSLIDDAVTSVFDWGSG